MIEHDHALHEFIMHTEATWNNDEEQTLEFKAVMSHLIVAFLAGQRAPMTNKGMADVQEVREGDDEHGYTITYEVKDAKGGVLHTFDDPGPAQEMAALLNRTEKCAACEGFIFLAGK